MKTKLPWKQIKRKTVYSSRFLKVFQDEVILPNGKTISDYTLIEKPSITLVVAINKKDQILLINEYKYAANQYLWGLPGGHNKDNENPINVAIRELKEEAAVTARSYDLCGQLKEYPSKDLHTVHVVKALGIKRIENQHHEDTETISRLRFFTKNQISNLIDKGKLQSSTTISSLVLAQVFH